MSLPFRQAGRAVALLAALALGWSVQAAEAPAQAPEETPEQALTRLLQAHRSELQVGAAGLQGAGLEPLLKRARAAQFVLVGEDHGFADVPEFVVALGKSLGADAPRYLVYEVGPYSAARAAAAARDDKMREFVLAYPGALPFFNLQEDGALAVAWQKGQKQDVIWGLDQEFIFSCGLIFERLRELAAPGKPRETVDRFIGRCTAADKEVMGKHDGGAALLLNMQPADFAELRAGVAAAPGSEASRLIDELDVSNAIYRGQKTDGYGSNNQRGQLMKRHFMEHYRAAESAGEKQPRALLRFGAYHMIRGITPTNLFDIGNFVSEFAASNGRESLHILVLAGGGTVNRWLPFVADKGLRTQRYDVKAEMEDFGAMRFVENAHRQGWTLYDLEPLRRQRKARKAGGTEFEKVVFGYDYVVVVAEGRAGKDYWP